MSNQSITAVKTNKAALKLTKQEKAQVASFSKFVVKKYGKALKKLANE